MKGEPTGVLLILSWPDVYVSGTGGPYDGLFRLLKFNKGGKYKAGHAALVLIERASGLAEFYDFGRYITPQGAGRVRGPQTDPEVTLPFTARFEKSQILNLEEIFQYLAANPTATHGEGRMLASVNYEVDYQKARHYIHQLQANGSMTYSPFKPKASNCSRFVADTLKRSAENWWLRIKNTARITITPSPLGNVLNGSSDKLFFQVEDGKIKQFKGGRYYVLKEVLGGFLETPPSLSSSLSGTLEEPPRPDFLAAAAQWLGGVGAGAWFHLEATSNDEVYTVQRISPRGEVDYCHKFKAENEFNAQQPFQFIYDSNASYCTLKQGGRKVRLTIN